MRKAIFGNLKSGKEISYNPNDPKDTKKAYMKFFGFTKKEYKKRLKTYKSHTQKLNYEYPLFKDFIWFTNKDNNNIYYIDEYGKKIMTAELKLIKEMEDAIDYAVISSIKENI